MNRCADLMRRAALAVLVAGLIAGCAAKKPKPDTKPAASKPAAEAPAKPAADKGDPEARFAEALELMRHKQSGPAEAAFIALIKDFPEFSGPQTNLGILLAKSNRRDVAIAAFTKAATANGENASAMNWLGILNREAGKFEQARQSYEKALAIRPDYAAAQLNLGLLLDEYMKRPADALPHYQEYLRISGGKDLRVLPWIAEIESRLPKPAETPAVPAAATPAAPSAKAAK
ncbi:MAG: tetratricopeptide repeat protein [Panacagrimonas sp.]